MIDLSKYDGHRASEGRAGLLRGVYELDEATSALLNDAPLLLEEIKRLREETKWFRECLCRHIGYDYCKSEYEKHFGREMIE